MISLSDFYDFAKQGVSEYIPFLHILLSEMLWITRSDIIELQESGAVAPFKLTSASWPKQIDATLTFNGQGVTVESFSWNSAD